MDPVNLNTEYAAQNFLGIMNDEFDERFELADDEDDDDENVNPSFILETL